jgi:hypothetical protein
VVLVGALLPAPSGAAPASTYVHDVKVFHQKAGQRARPQPAQIALIVGGKPVGKLISGLKRNGKQFVIADVKGGRVAYVGRTGSRARISLDVSSTCRANPRASYYLRATARIGGALRRAFSRGDCGFVVQVLERDARAITHTTFVFEN